MINGRGLRQCCDSFAVAGKFVCDRIYSMSVYVLGVMRQMEKVAYNKYIFCSRAKKR